MTLLVIAGMSAAGGYRSGIAERTSLESTQIAGNIQTQFEMALDDVQARHYDLARQRLEWVVEQDPNYPGVTDVLALIILETSITATPTQAPTPTLTPTPDLRSVEEKFLQAQQAMVEGNWDQAIDTLLQLRKDKPDYYPIQIDGMLYVALRNRGVDKIKNADLEGGTYDLALASRFGPLDAEASNYKSWAEMYVTGASFWEVDWAKAVSYFKDLSVIAPYLSDASHWTSIERYRQALIGYGDWLAQQGQWCDAQDQYEASLKVGSDPKLEPTATYAAEECSPSAPEEESGGKKKDQGGSNPPPEPNVTIIPEQTQPPAPEATPTPTPQPSPQPLLPGSSTYP